MLIKLALSEKVLWLSTLPVDIKTLVVENIARVKQRPKASSPTSPPLSPQRYPNRTQSSGSPFCPTFIQEQSLQTKRKSVANATRARKEVGANVAKKCIFQCFFANRVAGQATLIVASCWKVLTTTARRQAVKVVKLTGLLASVVSGKTQQKSNTVAE